MRDCGYAVVRAQWIWGAARRSVLMFTEEEVDGAQAASSLDGRPCPESIDL
jgi:hypothetical protein